MFKLAPLVVRPKRHSPEQENHFIRPVLTVMAVNENSLSRNFLLWMTRVSTATLSMCWEPLVRVITQGAKDPCQISNTRSEKKTQLRAERRWSFLHLVRLNNDERLIPHAMSLTQDLLFPETFNYFLLISSSAGLQTALLWRLVLRSRGHALLRDTLSRQTWIAMRWLL